MENLKPIVVIVSMKKEAKKLIQKLENLREEKILNYNFYIGTIEKYPVIIVVSGVGEINSSGAASVSILKYNPCLILNYGVAGAHEKSILPLDLIIGTKLLNINSLIYSKDNFELISFKEGKDEITYLESSAKIAQIANKTFENYSFGKVYNGIIGSGDVWNKDPRRIEFLNKTYNTLCEEMEGIAISEVCHINNIPYFEFRVISNNNLINDAYNSASEEICQEQAWKLLKEIIKEASRV